MAEDRNESGSDIRNYNEKWRPPAGVAEDRNPFEGRWSMKRAEVAATRYQRSRAFDSCGPRLAPAVFRGAFRADRQTLPTLTNKTNGLIRAERTGGRVGIPHKHAGTWLAEQQVLNVLSGVVFGHHGGLPSQARLKSEIAAAEGSHRPQVEEAVDRISTVVPEILTGPGLPEWIEHSQDPMALDVLIRMVFSAVVHADYLDTAAHFDGEPRRPTR